MVSVVLMVSSVKNEQPPLTDLNNPLPALRVEHRKYYGGGGGVESFATLLGSDNLYTHHTRKYHYLIGSLLWVWFMVGGLQAQKAGGVMPDHVLC